MVEFEIKENEIQTKDKLSLPKKHKNENRNSQEKS